MRSGQRDSDQREHRGGERGARTAARDTALDDRGDAIRQILTAARQSLVRRRRREPEVPRDVIHRALLVIEEHEWLAIDLGHLAECRADDPLALRIGDRVVRRGLTGDVVDVLEHLATPALARIASDVARDPAQPRGQAVRIAKVGEPPPRDDERILRHVVGEAAIAGRAERDGVHGALVPLDEPSERGAVAAPARLDQLAVRLHVPL